MGIPIKDLPSLSTQALKPGFSYLVGAEMLSCLTLEMLLS